MVPWFFRDPARLTLERSAIGQLSQRAPWLVGVEWKLEDGLVLDAIIRAHDHDYEVRVSFPPLYPDAPSVVRPKNMEHRLSSHQYGGANGPLCLEWGPDNWHSGVTSADMLESTFRLLDLENPLGQTRPETPVVAPSRHSLTLGQELRSARARWHVSNNLLECLRILPPGTAGEIRSSLRNADGTFVGLIHSITPFGGKLWPDISIGSAQIHSTDFYTGVFFKTRLTALQIGAPHKLSQLADLLSDYRGKELLASDGTSPIPGFNPKLGASVLIVDASGAPHFFVVYSTENVLRLTPVHPPSGSPKSRAPLLDVLAGKSVGIVGVGSVGSTMALGLARAGVSKIHVVDYDILLPENLRRNALDWNGVLLHKVDAVKAAIARVAPTCEVTTSNVHLAGQESNAFVGVTQTHLAACDILVDATGNARAFNIIAAIAKAATKPMVWMEVFGGGIGGMVARSRPEKDPVPQEMRNAFLQFCQTHPDPAVELPLEDYAAEREGRVIVASDAEAGIIAHTAIRMVVDCLASEPTKFPFSMYLIGFDAAWVFTAPFATIPIAMDHYSPAGWKVAAETKLSEAEAAFLLKLLEKNSYAPDHPQ